MLDGRHQSNTHPIAFNLLTITTTTPTTCSTRCLSLIFDADAPGPSLARVAPVFSRKVAESANAEIHKEMLRAAALAAGLAGRAAAPLSVAGARCLPLRAQRPSVGGGGGAGVDAGARLAPVAALGQAPQQQQQQQQQQRRWQSTSEAEAVKTVNAYVKEALASIDVPDGVAKAVLSSDRKITVALAVPLDNGEVGLFHASR